jgi:hypothetical protein
VMLFAGLAAFFADAERSADGRLAEAHPPSFRLFRRTRVSGTPLPEPLLLPPPLSLFTVAQAPFSFLFWSAGLRGS